MMPNRMRAAFFAILLAACSRRASPSVEPTASTASTIAPVVAQSSMEPIAIAPPHPIVLDAHDDTPSKWLESPFDLAIERSKGRGLVDFPRMQKGGVDAAFFIAYVSRAFADHGGKERALVGIDAIHRMVDPHPELAEIARSVDDVRRIAAGHRRAILIGIEGGHAIEDSLTVLDDFYARGARYLTLTHFNTNHWADSSADVALHHGLTKFGEDVVREMNRLGMLVDVSHASDETFFDVAAVSKAPLFASHSSARALCNHPRNVSDEMLRAVGKSRGIVMVTFVGPYVECTHAKPTLARLVDHIEHVIDVAGIDSVGIGSDFDNDVDYPAGLEDIGKLGALADELRRRGHAQSEVDKVMGENFMRVFAETERIARELGD